MAIEMKTVKRPVVKTKAENHADEIDRLSQQCDVCKIYKPQNKHGGCEVRYKLVSQDNEVAWKNKHLFLQSNGHCKMFKEK